MLCAWITTGTCCEVGIQALHLHNYDLATTTKPCRSFWKCFLPSELEENVRKSGCSMHHLWRLNKDSWKITYWLCFHVLTERYCVIIVRVQASSEEDMSVALWGNGEREREKNCKSKSKFGVCLDYTSSAKVSENDGLHWFCLVLLLSESSSRFTVTNNSYN